MLNRLIATLSAFLLCALHATAAEAPGQFQASLKPQTGNITLPGNIAQLKMPDGFAYLNPDDVERLLHDGWGNPPGRKTLGMIVPANVDVLSRESWGVVITYDKDGHVKDDDADKINYADLLKEIQEGMEENNKSRREQGYKGLSLVGWAEQPTYDRAHHKLYWAQDLLSEGESTHTLNYNVRVLGREGVLVLNAIASMEQIGAIKTEMKTVTGFTEFTSGNRYADFNEATDKVAEYGIAALVAGGIAGKLGLFGKLLALLVAFKKLIFMAVVGIGAWVYKVVTGRKKEVDGDASVQG